MRKCVVCGSPSGPDRLCEPCYVARRKRKPKPKSWFWCPVCAGINGRHAPSCKR